MLTSHLPPNNHLILSLSHSLYRRNLSPIFFHTSPLRLCLTRLFALHERRRKDRESEAFCAASEEEQSYFWSSPLPSFP